jgi:Flp pilus assembly protein TadB
MVDTPVLTSTLLLTLLLFVGLFFFVKASVKDRTQQSRYGFSQSADTVLVELGQYFQTRAYRVMAVNDNATQVTLAGQVRPSLFLASLLTGLVVVGLMCLSLVLATLLPQIGLGFLGIVVFAPLATWFYWQRAARQETIALQVLPDTAPNHTCLLQVTAHRDELRALESTWQIQPIGGASH